MTYYSIISPDGVDYGVWEGATPEAAFAAMQIDIGWFDGTADDWIILEGQPA